MTRSMLLTYWRSFYQRYWPLIKSLQTGLLLITGVAGYMSARCPVIHAADLAGLAGSLFLAIAGATLLNMWYDRDIDACMRRTCERPLSSGAVSADNVLRLGLLLSLAGIAWAAWIEARYALLVFGGWFFDVLVYTLWLKRRSAWSIVWGGLAGGMPIMAGRALGLGQVDWIGGLMCLAVLLWIPTHILTFAMRYSDDYRRAGIPTFAAQYGFAATRTIIAVSAILAALSMGGAALAVGMTQGALHLLGLLCGGLMLLAGSSLLRPSERANFRLFKYASAYMLVAMLLFMFTG